MPHVLNQKMPFDLAAVVNTSLKGPAKSLIFLLHPEDALVRLGKS